MKHFKSRTACVLLTLLAYGILGYSGFLLVQLLATLITKGAASGVDKAVAGLLLGGVGAGALFAALRLAPTGADPAALDRRQMLLFGLFFPGAAQIYARRWTLGVTLLLGPFAVFMAAFWAAGVVHAAAPQLLPAWSSSALMLTIPVSYALLWLGSLSEAHFWAGRQPPDIDAAGWPRGRGVIATFGALLFLLPAMEILLLGYMGVLLRATASH